jgi:hypothetical protein
MIGFIDTLYTQFGTTGNTALLLITVTHVLVFSLFTSRILATDFITVCHFKSHIRSSFHSLIHFLPLFCDCQLRSNFPSSYPGKQALETRLDATPTTTSFGTLLYNHCARTTQKTQRPYCWENVFTAQLHSNGS